MKLPISELRKRPARVKEVLKYSEEEPNLMADFEELFIETERKALEGAFVKNIQKAEEGDRGAIELTVTGLGALDVLDQALRIPIIGPDLRQRAIAVIEKELGQSVDKIQGRIDQKGADLNHFWELALKLQRFPRLRSQVFFPQEVLLKFMQEQSDPKESIVQADNLAKLLFLQPSLLQPMKQYCEQQGFNSVAWSAIANPAYNNLSAAQLFRLFHPDVQLTTKQRRQWINNYLEINQDSDLAQTLGLSLVGYAKLAILLGPRPTLGPDGKVDLGMPKEKLERVAKFPERPHI